MSIAICPAPFQSRRKKGSKKKVRADGHAIVTTELLGQIAPMSHLTELEAPIVRHRHPPPQYRPPEPPGSRVGLHSPPRAPHPSQRPLPRHTPHYQHAHCNCAENDSQQSFTSNESHSTHNSSGYHSCGGYQSDDGTFESKLLRKSNRDRPVNLRMTAIRDYTPCCEEELPVRRGQRVRVLYRNHDWVYAVTKAGEGGYIPYSYVRPSRKYAGYQSEPEFAQDGDYYSGYETDIPLSRSRIGHRNQIGDTPPAYSVHHGFSHHGSDAGFRRASSGSPPEGRRAPTNGYLSAVEEYPSSLSYFRHPQAAKSLHNILDASSPKGIRDYRPIERKPDFDSFEKNFIEELVVIHDFEAKEEDEVVVSKGERVKVLNADDPFWLWVGTIPDDEGFIPRSCCSLGNHPLLQNNPTRPMRALPASRRPHRYYQFQQAKARSAAKLAREHAKQRFHELARLRNNPHNPACMDKEEIQRIGSKLLVLMDYTPTEDDELSVVFAETLYADVLKQGGTDRIWAYCPRTDSCGYVPVSLVAPPVV